MSIPIPESHMHTLRRKQSPKEGKGIAQDHSGPVLESNPPDSTLEQGLWFLLAPGGGGRTFPCFLTGSH